MADHPVSAGPRGGEGLIRRVAWAIAIAGSLLACGAVAAAGTQSYRRDDFWCLRTAGQLVLERRDPYDLRTWAETAGAPVALPDGRVAPSACTGAAFAYPLWTALGMVPFAMLPPEASATLWVALSVGAVAWGASWSWSAFGGPSRSASLCAVLVAFSQPLWFVLRYGQTTGIELGLLGLTAWSLARARERSAGAAFASLALKPQLVVLAWLPVLVEALRRGRRPFLAAATATGLAGAALSLVITPTWPIEWLQTVLGPRLRIAALLPTVWGLANDTLGSPAWGAALVVALVLVLAVLLRGVAVDRVALLALGVGVSLFASPHVWSYDHLLLVLPWTATLAIGARLGPRGHRPLIIGAILVASLLPWVAYAVSTARVSETYAAVVPALSALLFAVALRLGSRAESAART
ncbi:MAG: DUF2029 domain-containing protein [Chloroflexota bacterium]|nr:DUF2029 domain-containing protein [Chloroflexota bacterium]